MKTLKRPKFSLASASKVRLPKQASAVKAFFLSRAFREKILLLAFVLLIAVTWLSSAMERTGKFVRQFRMTSEDLKGQADWLSQRERIDANAKAAVEHLDPAKTFDGLRLQNEVTAILDRLGIKPYGVEPAISERASVFTKHSIQVTIRNVDYASLVKFYLEVVKRTPYIGFEQVLVSVTNNSHSASMRVTSVELDRK